MPSKRSISNASVEVSDQYEYIVDIIKRRGSPVYTHVSKSAPPDAPPSTVIPGQFEITFGRLQEETNIPGLALLLKAMKTARQPGQVIDFVPAIIESKEELVTLLPHKPTLEEFHVTSKGSKENGGIVTSVPDSGHDVSASLTSTQLLLTSLLACDQEQAVVIAKEEMGIEIWKEVKVDAVLEKASGDEEDNDGDAAPESQPGKDAFPRPPVPYKKITLRGIVQTSASQEQIQSIVDQVAIRCPIRSLLSGAGTEIVTVWEKAAPVIREYSVTGHSQGTLASTTTCGEFTVHGDQAEEDGGTDTGPNPVQHVISAIISAGNTLASNIACDELGIEDWGPVDYTASVTANLDGLLGEGDVSEPLAPSAFTRAVVDVKVHTSASEDEVKRVQQMVAARCPIRRLMTGAGCEVTGIWTKA